MTIPRTVILSLLAMTTSTAGAQCYRSRTLSLYTSPHVSIYQPRVTIQPRTTYRPHLIVPQVRTAHLQTAEVAPDPSAIVFGACGHVDELAARLELLMNELCLDLAYNYTHNIDFHATYTEAYTLFQMARSIHAAEHNFDREAVRQQLAGADELFHHIQDDVRGWTRNPRRQIGTLGIMAKMEAAEDTLHHLMTDVGVVLIDGPEQPPSPQDLQFAPAAPLPR